LANVTYPTFRDWKGRKTGELLTFASYDFIGDKIARKTHANYSYYGRTDFKYDELGRIERLHSYRIYDTIADLYYSYEPGTNNISDITYAHKPSTPENSYVYDDINRLTQATYFSDLNDNEVFTLDNLGNRSNVNLRSGSDLAYQIDTDTNQYSQIGGNNISYDNAGNLSVDENGYIYSYDYENRLVKVNDGSYDIVTYDYDALGRRIRMTDMSGENDIVTTYYYNDNWQVIGEYKTGMPVKSYYYGNGIDEVLVSYYGVSGGSITGITVYSLDHLNSPIAVIDNTGNIVERYEYSAYGEADIFTAGTDGTYFTADDVHDLTVSTVDNRISFTGRELDILDGGDLRIMYYRNRYYTPTHGRFLTKDPLGIVPYARLGNELFFVSFQYIDGINVYQYARSNTVNNIDSLGLAVRVYFDCVLTDTQKEGCRKRCFYFCYDNGKKREILHYPPEPTDVDDPRIPSTFELVESTFRWGKCDKKISKVKIFGDLPNWPTNCSRSACRERAEAAKTAGEWACKLVPNKGGSVLCEAAVIAAYEAAMAACDMCENP
jgi:RHS repeat-associated protein